MRKKKINLISYGIAGRYILDTAEEMPYFNLDDSVKGVNVLSYFVITLMWMLNFSLIILLWIFAFVIFIISLPIIQIINGILQIINIKRDPADVTELK